MPSVERVVDAVRKLLAVLSGCACGWSAASPATGCATPRRARRVRWDDERLRVVKLAGASYRIGGAAGRRVRAGTAACARPRARQRARPERGRDLGRRPPHAGGLRARGGRARAARRRAGGRALGVPRRGRPARRPARAARAAGCVDPGAARVIHEIPLEEATLHGYFSSRCRRCSPSIPATRSRFQSLNARLARGIRTPSTSSATPELHNGHALTGPDRGARRARGTDARRARSTRSRRAAGASRSATATPFDWTLDGDTATDERGKTVSLAPFMGVIGMPPPEPGVHSTGPPRKWGGNIDCKLLVAGTTLYLPIPLDGAVLSAGDGHAAQGDGEVSGTAIECPLERAQVTLDAERPRAALADRAHRRRVACVRLRRGSRSRRRPRDGDDARPDGARARRSSARTRSRCRVSSSTST